MFYLGLFFRAIQFADLDLTTKFEYVITPDLVIPIQMPHPDVPTNPLNQVKKKREKSSSSEVCRSG